MLMMAGLAGVAAGEPNREFITEVKLSFGGRNSADKLAQEISLSVAGEKKKAQVPDILAQ